MEAGPCLLTRNTKLEFISRAMVSSLCGGHHVRYQFLESSRASGDVLVMWDNRVFDIEEVSVGSYSTSLSFKILEIDSSGYL